MTRGAWIAVAGSATLAFVLAIVLVVVIAVDGNETDPDPTPTTAAPQTFGGPLGGGGVPPEVEECLSEQGVEPPGSSGGIPSDSEIERMRQALEECGLPAPQIFAPGH